MLHNFFGSVLEAQIEKNEGLTLCLCYACVLEGVSSARSRFCIEFGMVLGSQKPSFDMYFTVYS